MSELLNRKQLEDAAKCSVIKCEDCINNPNCEMVHEYYINAELAKTAIEHLKNYETAVEMLSEKQQEIDQLKQQAAVMREALEELKDIYCNDIKCKYEYCKPECAYYSSIEKASKSLLLRDMEG